MVSATARLTAGRCVKNHCRWGHPRVNATAAGDNESARLSPIAGILLSRRDIFVREIGLAGAASVFPLSVSGSVRLKLASAPTENSIRAAVARIADMLDEKSTTSARAADCVIVEGNVITIRMPWFRITWGWNILAPFNAGRVEVSGGNDAITVRYAMSTVAMFIFTTLPLVAALALTSWAKPDTLSAIRSFLPWFGLAWLWIFGMNYLIAMIRFPLWLRRGIRRDPELKRR